MGITESKILLGKLATACSSAERNKQNGIQHVLSDKQFVRCLTVLWNNLPNPSKDEITGRKRRKKSLKKLKHQQIEISSLLKPNLNLWANEPKSFLDPITHGKPVAEVTCLVATYYQELSVAEIRSAGDTIRLRFLKVIFHHLKDRFCVSYLRPDAVKWLATRVAAAGLDSGDTGKISDKIKNWAYLGGKYDALCRDIGNYKVAVDYKYLGNLIRLPEDVTDRFILKELKVKGPDRKREIDSLMRRGVYQSNKENDDIDCLADTIFRHMWDQIESYIPPDDAQHGRIFSSLQDWRKLHGTRVLRLQNGDHRTQVAREEERHISSEDNELTTWDRDAHARATGRCVTLSPSAQDDENGRMDHQLPGSPGSSSSQSTSDLARSDVSDSSGSTGERIMLYCGDTPTRNPLVESNSAEEVLPGASSSPQLRECPSVSAPEGTQPTERLLAQSTFTSVEGEGISDTGSLALGIPPTRTDYTQWTNEVVGSIPICRAVDSGSSSLGVFDVTLHRETQTTQDPPAMTFSSNSVARDTCNPGQYGQPSMSIDDPAAQVVFAMQFGSNSLASHETFNPRQYGQPTMSLDDPAAQDALAVQFGSNSFASHDTFNPRQHGQPTMSLDDPAAQDALAVQFGSNSFASHDTFNPRQHGQPMVSLNGPGAQDAIGTQLYSSQMPHDAFGAHNVFNPRHYGQPMASLNEPTLVDVDFGPVEVQS